MPSDTEPPEPLLTLRGVTKRFGGTLAVHEIDLDFRRGEVHALLGANGAGKSTLIKLLAGVHEPDSGAIYLGGQRIDHVRPRPPMAFIHQELGLIEWMTVAENIASSIGERSSEKQRSRSERWAAPSTAPCRSLDYRELSAPSWRSCGHSRS